MSDGLHTGMHMPKLWFLCLGISIRELYHAQGRSEHPFSDANSHCDLECISQRMCGTVQPAAENSPQFTKSLVHGKRPFSAGTMHAVASALAPISALPGSEPPSGLPMPGEASASTEQGETPDQALHRALTAQMQHTVGQLTGQPAGQPASSSVASAPSLQRPPAPLFVGQVMPGPTLITWLCRIAAVCKHWLSHSQKPCLLNKQGRCTSWWDSNESFRTIIMAMTEVMLGCRAATSASLLVSRRAARWACKACKAWGCKA